MIRKVTLSVVAAAFACSAFAGDNSDLMKRLENLEKQLNAVQSENKELKKDMNEFRSSIKGEMAKELGKAEGRVDDIETMVLLNKINFGLGFKTRVDTFEGKRADGAKYVNNNLWTNKFMLNMDSAITDDMKFTGRLSMYKNWATANNNPQSTMDPLEGRRPSDTTLFVERAYIDWIVNKGQTVPVTVTIGRQPSSDGPSHQFKDNTVRKSTYSALGFDGAADGVVTTANLEKLTGVTDAAVRFALGKSSQNYNTNQMSNNPYIGVANHGIKDSSMYGLFAEAGVPGVANSLIHIGAVKGVDINPTGSMNMGDLNLYGAFVEFTNLAESGVDLFAHVGLSKTKPNGMAMPLMGAGMPTVGMMSFNGDTTEKTGSAYWVGGRYTLPLAYKGKVGFEYNHGSKNWIAFTQGSNDLTNKLATRGDAYEAYFIHPINRYASLRLGATWINNDYTGSGSFLGEPMKMGDNGTQGELKKLTNYYLLFNLLF